MPSRIQAYYFGCWRESGHALFNIHGTKIPKYNTPHDFPVNPDALDGSLIKPSKYAHREGTAFYAVVNNWSIVTVIDNSVDTRPGSISVFLISGTRSFEKVMLLSKKAFRRIFERFNFEIELVK